MTKAVILIYKIHPFVPAKDLIPKITVTCPMGCSKNSLTPPPWKQGFPAATSNNCGLAATLPSGN